MFQFPGSAPLARYHAFSMVGCPIRTPADQFLFADPRSFSQLTTSFFASESLGIPHTPFLTSLSIHLCARCSDTLLFTKRLPFYYLLFLLYYFSSMSMNSLPVYSYHLFQDGYPKIKTIASNNAIISRCILKSALLPIHTAITYFNFSSSSFG